MRPKTPLFVQIASTLQDEIARGVYRSSGKLPTETELCTRFGASLSTVRQALGRLGEIGLVRRKSRAGTVIVATEPPTTFVHRVSSLRELLAYPADTYRELISDDFMRCDAQLAERLGCEQGREWYRMTVLRRSAQDTPPLCWGEFYVQPEVGRAIDWPRIDRERVHDRLKQLGHHQAHRVEMRMHASAIRGSVAEALAVGEGAPGLTVLRRYFNEQDENFTSTVTVHPEHRFVFSMEMLRHE